MFDESEKYWNYFKRIPEENLKKRLLEAIPKDECLRLLDQWEFIRLKPDLKSDEEKIGAPFRKRIEKFRIKKTTRKDTKNTKALEREHARVTSHYLKRHGIAEPLPPSLTALDADGNITDWNMAWVICNAFPRKGSIGSAEDRIYLGCGRFTDAGKRKGHRTTYAFGIKTSEQIAKEDKIPVTIDFSVPKRERDKEHKAFVKGREDLRKKAGLKDPKNRLKENRDYRKVYETVKELERKGNIPQNKLWNYVAEVLQPQLSGEALQNLIKNLPRQYRKCCAEMGIIADK